MDDYNSKFTGPEIDDAIARAIPGGGIDTLLSGKAPAGYGLGTDAVSPPNNSLDDAVKNGWYLCAPSFKGAPTGHNLIGYGTVLAIVRGSDCVIQVYWSEASSSIAGSPLNLVRKYNGTTWSPWEWVNPPMMIGGIDADGNPINEYRTTERYLGKPVYAMAVDFGNLPNATTKEITVRGVSSPNKVVSVFGYTSDRKTIPTFSYGWGSISTISDAVALNASAHPNLGLMINVTTQSNRSSATAVIIVKYTKSTD